MEDAKSLLSKEYPLVALLAVVLSFQLLPDNWTLLVAAVLAVGWFAPPFADFQAWLAKLKLDFVIHRVHRQVGGSFTREQVQVVLKHSGGPEAAVSEMTKADFQMQAWLVGQVGRLSACMEREAAQEAVERRGGDVDAAASWVKTDVLDPWGWKCLCGFPNLPLDCLKCPACEKDRATADIARLQELRKQPPLLREKFISPAVCKAVQEWEELQAQQQEEMEKMMKLQSLGLVENEEEFECPTLFVPVPPKEGAILKNCGCKISKDGLKGHITARIEDNTHRGIIVCPVCNSDLQEEEIRALSDEQAYAKWEDAVNRNLDGRVSCTTADCKGFVIIEDTMNRIEEFTCQICDQKTCIACRAVHAPQNCKEYQDDLKRKADNDVAVKASLDFLNNEVGAGRAMRCPNTACGVVVVHVSGCNWMRCSSCRTELCWHTKLARRPGPWGPGCGGGHACH